MKVVEYECGKKVNIKFEGQCRIKMANVICFYSFRNNRLGSRIENERHLPPSAII